MRYVFGALSLILLLFAAVQYNDPDFYLWVLIYLVPAVWSGLVAVRPAALADSRVFRGVLLCLAAAVAGTVYYWPADPLWWQRDVWWESEGAREGMGMMVVTAVLAALSAAAMRRRRDRP